MIYRTTVSVALCATLLSAQSTPPESQDAMKVLKKRAIEELAAVGYEVPVEVSLERRTPRQVRQDFASILNAEDLAGLFWMFRSLDINAGRNTKVFNKSIVRAVSLGLSAYYHAPRKSFVILDTPIREMSEAMSGGLGPLFVHELVHANQDARKPGILDFFAAAQTTDQRIARRCVLEGEAEIVAVAALRGKAHLDGLSPADFDLGAVESTLAGVASGLIYKSARIWALDRYQAKGFDGLRAAYLKPPSSSEQVVHPEKSGVDLPTAVTIPKLSARYVRLDTDSLGELQIHAALLTAKIKRRAAMEASIGWDGDLVVVLREAESKKPVASVWRSVWDREVDAQQFEAVMNGLRKGGHKREMFARRKGRAVDIVFSLHTPIAEDIFQQLEGTLKSPDIVEADAELTAKIEEAALKALPVSKFDGEFWSHESFGLKVPMPDAWTVKTVGSLDVLRAPLAKGSRFAANINVQAVPNGGISDLKVHLESNRKQINSMKSLDLDAIEIVDHAGVPTLRCEYHGRMPGSFIDLHFLCLIYMRGAKQIVVTLTSQQSEWKDSEAEMRKIMSLIQIEKK